MTNKIFEGLNQKQIEAVRAVGGPVLVISGPGSGKTKCLTHRIAYLIQNRINPAQILAATFTNKAAGEMKTRVIKLLDLPDLKYMPLIGTFHSICLRILRREIAQLGYSPRFTIADTEDQTAIVKRIMTGLEIDTKKFSPKIILGKISTLKTGLVEPENYHPHDFYSRLVARIYNVYQTELKQINTLDFDDLIGLTVKLFRTQPEILEKYQERWKYILVDEYQDTSHDQYVFISLLAKKYQNIFCIGDDAQCLPPETKIITKEGLKTIKEVKVGDKISSPAGLSHICFSEVMAVKKFYYDGPMIEIKTRKGYILRSTPNHIIFGKLVPSEKFYITYLMYSKEIGYRIGTTVGLRNPKNGVRASGLRVRANQEKSDKMWILKLSPTRADAQFWEAYYAFKYGIPTTIFFANRGKGSKPVNLTQKHIDKLFELIPTREKVEKLMQDEYLFFEYPHHRPQGTIRYQTKRIAINLSYFSTQPGPHTKSLFRGARVSINNKDKTLKKLLLNNGLRVRNGKSNTWRVETSFRDNSDAEILAQKISSLCNVEISKRALITDLNYDFLPASQIHSNMVVPVYNRRRVVNDQVISVKRLDYKGPVYDLDIKRTHTYIANNFTVHNSIYQFRQADIRNILNFQKDYPRANIILLEQNYRSTQNIITAAQEVISNNRNQIQKSLWTANDLGEKILIKETLNERTEADFVVAKSLEMTRNGYGLKDIAVLYRTHAQSRAVEEALISNGVPYRIVGGIKFYERKEIKDILAYLKIIENPADRISFERVVNVPPRGIGKITLDKSSKNEKLTASRQKSLSSFLDLLNDFKKAASQKKLTSLIKYVINKTDYEKYLKDFGAKGIYFNAEERLENLKELLTVAKKYDDDKDGLEKFLEEIALLQDTDKLKDTDNKMTLMTIHASKGLEFPVVFLVGVEEGLFPQNRAIIEPHELEEERRLCYVAITRAKNHVIIIHARFRNIFGSTEINIPSRFINEIPTQLTSHSIMDLDDYEDKEKIHY